MNNIRLLIALFLLLFSAIFTFYIIKNLQFSNLSLKLIGSLMQQLFTFILFFIPNFLYVEIQQRVSRGVYIIFFLLANFLPFLIIVIINLFTNFGPPESQLQQEYETIYSLAQIYVWLFNIYGCIMGGMLLIIAGFFIAEAINRYQRRSRVRQLKTKASGKEEDCSICYSGFEEKETVYELPCSHVYHVECLEIWFREKYTCPMCRYDLNDIMLGI